MLSPDKPNIKIDFWIFRLHYKYTAPLFIFSSLLVLARQYFNPIDCFGTTFPVDRDIVENHCYNQGTYTVQVDEKIDEVPHPGISLPERDQIKIFYYYYPWVSLTLFIQGLFFLVTRFCWTKIENGKIRTLINDLHKPNASEEEKDKQLHFIVNYFIKTFHNHFPYAFHYYFWEALNFPIVLGQFFFMDWFLGNKFNSYGWNWSEEYPINNVFPKVTLCDFNKFRNGAIQRDQAQCHLNINYLNEKVYLVLWFWIVLLIIISALKVILTIIYVLFGSKIVASMTRYMVQRPPSPWRSYETAYFTVKNVCNAGDRLFLDLISINMDPENFREFIEQVEAKLERKGYLKKSEINQLEM